MKSVFRRIFGALAALPLPQRIFSFVERSSALGQGKGWGAGTIAEEVAACCSLLSQTPHLLIDIGGNRGAYSQEFLSRFPDAEIHIFEPSSYNVKLLGTLFSSYPAVNVVGCALSDASGKLVLYSDIPGSGLGSLSKRRLDHFGIDMNEEEEVAVMRFDEYWKSYAPSHPVIDYVKIDVEGHELSVLKGFGDFLEKVRLVQFEFGGCNIHTRTYFQDFWYFFASKNFSLHRIAPRGAVAVTSYREADEFFATTNYIAINNAYVS
jgi:FkbM family methyltransferase